ncbi:MAG: GNAT family N-acetyltransferase [Chloroflexota bacterium]
MDNGTWAYPREEISFVIKDDSNIVGCCVLKKINWDAGEAEISYWIGSEFWNRGIGVEAARLTRNVAFEVYNFKFLHAHYLKLTNPASGKILEKLGFEPDAEKQDFKVAGRYKDAAPDDVWTFYKLKRETWETLKEPKGCSITSML